MKPPRILYAFSHYRDRVDQGEVMRAMCERLRASGIDIDCETATIDPPGPALHWHDLDARWKRGDPALMRRYERLARRCEGFDALINGAGINLHPEFVRQLPLARIYACFDDPESSEVLSRPVAHAYDLCLVGNIAEVETYRTWGARRAIWWPLGFRAHDYDPGLTRDRILSEPRPVDVALLCERWSNWRRQRLDTFASNFPEGVYRGTHWPLGWLPEAERVPLYQRTRIGPNFHNSTGPINIRTFALPANGVMQICDNRSHLGRIFAVGTEVIGVDTAAEAIEACRYYLAHEDERRVIAAAGWERSLRDYNEIAVFRRLEHAVIELLAKRQERSASAPAELATAMCARISRRPLAVAGHVLAARLRSSYLALRKLAGTALRALGLRR